MYGYSYGFRRLGTHWSLFVVLNGVYVSLYKCMKTGRVRLSCWENVFRKEKRPIKPWKKEQARIQKLLDELDAKCNNIGIAHNTART